MSKSKKRFHKALYYRNAIMEEFKFEQVHEIMKKADLKWHPDNRLPSIKELRVTAINIMDDTIEEWRNTGKSVPVWGYGGFEAGISKKGKLELHFCLETVTAEDIDEIDEICADDSLVDEDDDSDIDPEVKAVYNDYEDDESDDDEEDDEYYIVDETEE